MHQMAPARAPRAGYSKDLYSDAICAYAQEHPGQLRILEAGCGKAWKITLPHEDILLTGIDLDADAMRIRIDETRDLHEAIVADLRTVELESERYDIVYCAFVLEHVEGAEVVLDRLVAAIRPGGLLLLSIPDRASVYSFFARLAPHSVAVAYKRHIRHGVNAGKPGHGPFPVVFDTVVSWDGIQDYVLSRGLVLRDAYGDNDHLDVLGRLAPLADAALHAFAWPTRALTADHTNLALIIEVPDPRPHEVSVAQMPQASKSSGRY